MRKIQFWVIFWTIVIAIPVTMLSLIASAYLTDHLVEIAGSIKIVDFYTLTKYRDLILEIEAIGMILGIVIVVALIVVVLNPGNREKESEL